MRRAARRAARLERIKTRQDARTARKALGGGFGQRFGDLAEKLSNSYLDATGQQDMPQGQKSILDGGFSQPGTQVPLDSPDMDKKAGFGIMAIILAVLLYFGLFRGNKSKK